MQFFQKIDSISKLSRYGIVATAMSCGLVVIALPVNTQAGNSWLSKAWSVQDDQPRTVLRPLASNDSTRAVFDVVISLYNDPSGDFNPDNNTGSEQQTAYEEIIRHWADGVCEQSNGAHHLGKVQIFRKGAQQGKADVVWIASQWPNANVAGFGNAGSRINFGDLFSSTNFLDSSNHQSGGYTLAHEWGHYVYGLFDEYAPGTANACESQNTCWKSTPLTTDTPVTPSIMNSQWNASPSNYQWLNHSTSNNIGTTTKTAEGRVYGKSGWDTLVQSTEDDPKSGDKTVQPSRTRYQNLVSVAPTATDQWVKKELSGANTCRADLEILWMQDLAMQIVIDRSGSMSGSPMDNAKQAAQNLVQVAPDGQTALGVVDFDDVVTQTYPVTAIPDPGATVKTAIKAAIAGLYARDYTALYDAADLALTNLLAYQPPQAGNNNANLAKAVFLLSDGLDNSSYTDEASVIARYTANKTALYTFGYGSYADFSVLQNLSSSTGGLFFMSPTTLSEIQAAFFAASADVGNTQTVVENAQSTAPSSGTSQQPFVADSTIKSLTLVVNFSGSLGDLSFQVRDPSGREVVVFGSQNCNVSSVVACTQVLDETALSQGGTGTWSLHATNNNTGSSRDWTLSAISTAAVGGTYNLSIASLGGNSITYPNPLLLQVILSKGGGFITGLEIVSAEITAPDGTISSIALNDQGQNGDALAEDGIYSAILTYKANGTYKVRIEVNNASKQAMLTDASFAFSAPPPGQNPPLPQPQPVTENFSRIASVQLTVTGVKTDDHPNAIPGTAINADNVNLVGQIDGAGDLDFFQINNIQMGQPLAIRVSNLSLGMDPELTVYRGDGTQVASGNLTNARSPAGYVVLMIPAADVQPTMAASVRHRDANAAQGGYEISAGTAIVSDGLPGDVNGDGNVDALDVVAVINHFLGLQTWPKADVNGDGTVNALDVVTVINKVLGL